DGRAQHVGHLVRVESEDVAQNDDSELTRWEELQCGHESQGDGFGLLVPRFRAERHVRRTLEKRVRKWLEPYDLAEPGRLGRFNVRHIPLLRQASPGRSTCVEAS